ncbi:hypothetical protein CHLRE_17g733550v5 [Chlamydomonas reinhardtii]|uniref:Uncharacterized protein n=1 Tax=Chlamydomonas reinhardtii TaxID=3055 RepID=A0A2K3CR62_CHLRE|nr:uncharacterized protein CHLRE_17g733550v5 [Chlamydomonas reinhardtii]PNW70768.1 hypothetical protein CHLRE_17g733550v5 [Chlamydomonas reinhardtii]
MSLNNKGSFSYLNDDVNWIRLDAVTTAKVERISNSVARVYLVDNNNVQVAVPNNVTMMDEVGNVVAPFMQNFMITWVETYTLTLNGQVVMRINNQKEQSIWGRPDAAHGVD